MISVIVPVYNVESYLPKCLDSIVIQSYRDLEILLIDDGSPDGCGEICDAYARKDRRIRVFHTENRGLSAARNLGLREACGEYIGFVDSDDWIEPNMFEVLIQRLCETEADVCGCGYWEERSFGVKKFSLKKACYTNMEALWSLLSQDINNNVWNKLYRREVFRKISFPEKRHFEDIAVMHRIFYLSGKVAMVPQLLYHYRMRHYSISQTYSIENLMDYAEAKLKRYSYVRKAVEQRRGMNSNTKFATFELHSVEQELLLQTAAQGISKVWRWWYGCGRVERKQYEEELRRLRDFSKRHFPLLGFRSWPTFLRLSSPFIHSSSRLSLMIIYGLNQLFRKLWPNRGNVV